MLALYLSLLENTEEKCRFEEIYYENRSLLFQVANGILKDSWLAEDAVQNTFFSLAKNMKKTSGWNCIQIRNYLIIIVRNAALRIWNRQNKEFCPETVPENVSGRHAVEADVENQDAQKRLFALLRSLDPKYGDVLMLKYFYELKNREIAECLQLSLENVKIRLVRGKAMLKKKWLEGEKIDRWEV